MSRAGSDRLDSVAFINPNATQARTNRRAKLVAARARQALAAQGDGVGSAAGAGTDDKEIRKQQRMLRNRESAALSRKRRSDRIDELEVQVEHLEQENRRLRQRINDLELRASGPLMVDASAPPPRNLLGTPPGFFMPAPAFGPLSADGAISMPDGQGNCPMLDQSAVTAFSGIPGYAPASLNVISRPAVFA